MDNNKSIFPWGKGLTNYNLTNPTETNLFSELGDSLPCPGMYNVVLLDSKNIPSDFMVYVMERFFRTSSEQAEQSLLQLYEEGHMNGGTYTWEVAETKSAEIEDFARRNHYSLKCVIQESKEHVIKKS